MGVAIRDKGLSISKARKICSVINSENHKDWIQLALECPVRTVEKAVAMAKPRDAVKESLRFASGDRLELKLGVSEDWAKLLKRTKDLMSQKTKRNVSTVMKDYCLKNDPVEKAKRADVRRLSKGGNPKKAMPEIEIAELNTISGSNPDAIATSHGNAYTSRDVRFSSAYRSRAIPANVKHEVDLRDGGQCVYVNKRGKRCDSRRWLDVHHRKEFSKGGEHKLDNLETLCWAHHRMKHDR